MTDHSLLDVAEAADQSGWTAHATRPALCKSFRFDDFGQAFAFMGRVAEEAERLNHHPEWCNVWNRVDVVLTTHDAGGVTPLDLALARAMDAAAAQVAAEPR